MRILVAALTLILLCAIVGWWYWVNSPEHALREVAGAVSRHDLAAFRSRVDTHSLCAGAVDDLLADPIRVASGPGLAERILGVAVISVMRPQAVARLEESLSRFVEGRTEAPPADEDLVGQIARALRPPSLKEVLRSLGFSRETFRGLGEVRRQGRLAHAEMKFEPGAGKMVLVEVELANSSDTWMESRWRVVRLSNLPAVSRSLAGF